jgi:hypothetical protein
MDGTKDQPDAVAGSSVIRPDVPSTVATDVHLGLVPAVPDPLTGL